MEEIDGSSCAGNLCDDVPDILVHGEFVEEEHGGGDGGIKVSAGDFTAEEDHGGEGNTDWDCFTESDDDAKKDKCANEFDEECVKHDRFLIYGWK